MVECILRKEFKNCTLQRSCFHIYIYANIVILRGHSKIMMFYISTSQICVSKLPSWLHLA